jgi:hypothetical protein
MDLGALTLLNIVPCTSVADHDIFGVNPDPDPAIFVIDLQDANKKLPYFLLKFFCLLLFVYICVHLHNFSKLKSQKEPQNSRNQGFSYYFGMMIGGSGSGSISLTNRSATLPCTNLAERIPSLSYL